MPGSQGLAVMIPMRLESVGEKSYDFRELLERFRTGLCCEVLEIWRKFESVCALFKNVLN